jgi:hypothetical protein
MRNYLVMLSLLLTGCNTRTALIPIHYHFLDNPAERRVELIYQNTSRDTMCLLLEHWPNLAGKINQASDRVQLIVSHERFPAEDFGGLSEVRALSPGHTFPGQCSICLPERGRE